MGKNKGKVQKFNKWPHNKLKAMVYDCPVDVTDLYIMLLLCEMYQELEPLHEAGLIPDKFWPEMRPQDVEALWAKLGRLEEQIDGDEMKKLGKAQAELDKKINDLFSEYQYEKERSEMA